MSKNAGEKKSILTRIGEEILSGGIEIKTDTNTDKTPPAKKAEK